MLTRTRYMYPLPRWSQSVLQKPLYRRYSPLNTACSILWGRIPTTTTTFAALAHAKRLQCSAFSTTNMDTKQPQHGFTQKNANTANVDESAELSSETSIPLSSRAWVNRINEATVYHPFVTVFSLAVAEVTSQQIVYHTAAYWNIQWSAYVIAALAISFPFRKALKWPIWGVVSPLLNHTIPFLNEIKFSKASGVWKESSIRGRVARTYTSLGSLISLRWAGLLVVLAFYIGIRVFGLVDPNDTMSSVGSRIQSWSDTHKYYIDNFVALVLSGVFFPATVLVVGLPLAMTIVRSPIGGLLPKSSLIGRFFKRKTTS